MSTPLSVEDHALALAALTDIANFGDGEGYNAIDVHEAEFLVIRTVLEAAKREAELWEEIRAWWQATRDVNDELVFTLRGPLKTKEATLTEAAEWCHKEPTNGA